MFSCYFVLLISFLIMFSMFSSYFQTLNPSIFFQSSVAGRICNPGCEFPFETLVLCKCLDILSFVLSFLWGFQLLGQALHVGRRGGQWAWGRMNEAWVESPGTPLQVRPWLFVPREKQCLEQTIQHCTSGSNSPAFIWGGWV